MNSCTTIMNSCTTIMKSCATIIYVHIYIYMNITDLLPIFAALDNHTLIFIGLYTRCNKVRERFKNLKYQSYVKLGEAGQALADMPFDLVDMWLRVKLYIYIYICINNYTNNYKIK